MLFSSDKSARKELAAGAALKVIDPRQRLFYYSTDHCLVKTHDIPAVIKDKLMGSRDTLMQLLQPHGGGHLLAYLQANYMEQTMYRTEAIRLIKTLFYGVRKLIQHGYIHQDIKLANCVASNTRGVRLIDFGSLRTKDDLYICQQSTILSLLAKFPSLMTPDQAKKIAHVTTTSRIAKILPLASERNWTDVSIFLLELVNRENVHIDVKYFVNPPEYNLLSATGLADASKWLDRIRQNVSGHNSQLGAWYDRYQIGQAEQLTEFIAFLAMITAQSFEARLKLYTEHAFFAKCDVYGLGVLMLSLSPYLVNTSGQRASSDPAEALFIELVRGMLHPSPIHRWTIDRAIKQTLIIQKMEVNVNGVIVNTDPFTKNVDSDQLHALLKRSSDGLVDGDFDDDDDVKIPPRVDISAYHIRDLRPAAKTVMNRNFIGLSRDQLVEAIQNANKEADVVTYLQRRHTSQK